MYIQLHIYTYLPYSTVTEQEQQTALIATICVMHLCLNLSVTASVSG